MIGSAARHEPCCSLSYKMMIIIANKLGYFDAAMTQLWMQELKEISAMIFGLARSLGKEL